MSPLLPSYCRLSQEFVAKATDDAPLLFVVGAFAHGHLDLTYVDEMVAVSEFPLSAAYCIGRITNALA